MIPLKDISKIELVYLFSSFEIHLKKLNEMKKETELKKKKKYSIIDARTEELITRTNNNKKMMNKFN